MCSSDMYFIIGKVSTRHPGQWLVTFPPRCVQWEGGSILVTHSLRWPPQKNGNICSPLKLLSQLQPESLAKNVPSHQTANQRPHVGHGQKDIFRVPEEFVECFLILMQLCQTKGEVWVAIATMLNPSLYMQDQCIQTFKNKPGSILAFRLCVDLCAHEFLCL